MTALTPPPNPPTHSTLFRQWYEWLWTHVFKTWPSPVTEVAGGLVLLGVPVLFFLLLPLWLVIFLLSSGGNVIYGLRLDPNDAGEKSELPDGLIREGVIIVGLIILHLVHVL